MNEDLKEKALAETSRMTETKTVLKGKNFLTSHMSKGSNFNSSQRQNSTGQLSAPLNSLQVAVNPQWRKDQVNSKHKAVKI